MFPSQCIVIFPTSQLVRGSNGKLTEGVYTCTAELVNGQLWDFGQPVDWLNAMGT